MKESNDIGGPKWWILPNRQAGTEELIVRSKLRSEHTYTTLRTSSNHSPSYQIPLRASGNAVITQRHTITDNILPHTPAPADLRTPEVGIPVEAH